MFASEAAQAFEAMKEELMRSFPGQFALVCGRRLMGVYASVDEAMSAASQLFEGDLLPAGTPVLISEVAARSSIRVIATPYKRTAPAATVVAR